MAGKNILQKGVKTLNRHRHRLLCSAHQFDRYEAAFRGSIEKPTDFWAEVSQNVTWFKPWKKVVDTSQHAPGRW